MPRLHHAAALLAALLPALALPATTLPSAPTALASPPAHASKAVPVLHVSVGTGACATAHSDLARVDNPCWLQLAVAPGVRLGLLELGVAYEGRDLLKAVTFNLVRPPAVTTLGATASFVHEPSERWRLSAGGEAGWRRYMDFAGTGIERREGAADTVYLGATGRAALGLRPRGGRADRLEVSLTLRSDLKTAHATVDGVPWSAGGWSITMGLGLVSEW